MTSVNNALGKASDNLLRAIGTGSLPSGWSARELRREAERLRRREAKAQSKAKKQSTGA